MSREVVYRIVKDAGFPMGKSVVRRILTDRIYVDGRHFVDSSIAGRKVEQRRIPLVGAIPEEIFAANALVGKGTKAQRVRTETGEFIAQGRLFNGACGAPMKARPRKSRGGAAYRHEARTDSCSECVGLSLDADIFHGLLASGLRLLATDPGVLRAACARSEREREDDLRAMRAHESEAEIAKRIRSVTKRQKRLLESIAKDRQALEKTGVPVSPTFRQDEWIARGGLEIDHDLEDLEHALSVARNPIDLPIHRSPVHVADARAVTGVFLDVMTDRLPPTIREAILRREVFNACVSAIYVYVVDNGPADRYCRVVVHGSLRPLRDSVTVDVSPAAAAADLLLDLVHSGCASLEPRPEWTKSEEEAVEGTTGDEDEDLADLEPPYTRKVPDWIHEFIIPFGEGVWWRRAGSPPATAASVSASEASSDETQRDVDVQSTATGQVDLNASDENLEQRSSPKPIAGRRRKISCEDRMDSLFDLGGLESSGK